MRLSGHSYNNDVFNELLDNINKDVVLLKTAQKKDTPNMDLQFTQTTDEQFNRIFDEELRFIASELLFAAKSANVEMSPEDIKKFAMECKQQNLRGKTLERAARKYCSTHLRNIAEPSGVTHTTSAADLVSQARASAIVPASYPSDSVSDAKTGGYLGMSKNPNSIWDSKALERFATKPEDQTQMLGDEQISHSKKANEEFRYQQKSQFWQAVQEQLSDPAVSHSRILNASAVEKQAFNPKNPSNTMSMFDQNRDFANLPEKTAGEQISDHAHSRATKASTSRSEQTGLKPNNKADNTGSFLFKNNEQSHASTAQRSATDRLFDGLINSLQKDK